MIDYLWLTIRIKGNKEKRYVKVCVGDTYGDTDDDDIFYYYDSFEEVTDNNAIDFEVIEIDGTDINEFD
jgi:hypothetical protein